MIHASRPATFLGNLLDILVISRRVLAKHDHSCALLDASGLDRVAIEIFEGGSINKLVRNKRSLHEAKNKSY